MSAPPESSNGTPAHGDYPRHALTYLRNKFIAGLAFAIPLIATFAILRWGWAWLQSLSFKFVHWLTSLLANLPWLKDWVQVPEQEPTGAWGIYGTLVLVAIVFVCTVTLGVMVTNVIGSKIAALLERVLLKLPFVAFIYRTFKQVIDALKNIGATSNTFKRVVYIDYPADGCRLMGFVTGAFHDSTTGKDVTSIFLPTSPNPFTGFILIVEDHLVTDSDLSLEDGMKMLFSAGLVTPAQPDIEGT